MFPVTVSTSGHRLRSFSVSVKWTFSRCSLSLAVCRLTGCRHALKQNWRLPAAGCGHRLQA